MEGLSQQFITLDGKIKFEASCQEMESLIRASIAFVQEYMKQYDSSHDFSHISRVHCLAKRIHLAESQAEPGSPVLNSDMITLASLLHDVGDRKYWNKPGQDGTKAVSDFLLSQGADIATATKVQDIVNHVSYSSEIKNPSAVTAAIARNPELAVVQDADRLDALGAVGIARCFTFNASRSKQGAMDDAIRHFGDKLFLLEGMMKTRSGKAMASERSRRIRSFRDWWVEECEGEI